MSRIRNDMRASDLQGSDLRGTGWRKSSWSGPTGGNCVESAALPGGTVAVRNSRHPGGPALIFTAARCQGGNNGVAQPRKHTLALTPVVQCVFPERFR